MRPTPQNQDAMPLARRRERNAKGQYLPGFSGNPGGSPEATRRAFNKRFLLGLAEDWQQHGREVFKRVRRELAPKILEAVRRHFGVPDRVLDVLVPEVVLQRPRVVAIVSELEPTGMAQHVWVDRERHLGSLADALDESVKADGTHWPAGLGNEYVSLFRALGAACAEPASRHPGSGARWQSRS